MTSFDIKWLFTKVAIVFIYKNSEHDKNFTCVKSKAIFLGLIKDILYIFKIETGARFSGCIPVNTSGIILIYIIDKAPGLFTELNNVNQNIEFKIETEEKQQLNYLYLEILRKKNRISAEF